MQRCMLFTMAVLFGSLASVDSWAQEQTKADDTSKYYYEVRGASAINHPDPESVWGTNYETESIAEAKIKEWERLYAKGGLLEYDLDKPIKLRVVKMLKPVIHTAKNAVEAKDAVDKAKKTAENGLTAAERKLGDTLKEYTNRIKDAYQNATNAKKAVMSLTDKISEKQFNDANTLIDRFNRDRSSFSEKAGTLSGPFLASYPEMPRILVGELKGKLATDKAVGKWNVWVFKQNNGQWEKQEDQSLSTDDEREAQKYLDESKGKAGFTATSNLPNKFLDIANSKWVGKATVVFDDGTEQITDNVSYTFESNGRSLYQNPGHNNITYSWKIESGRITLTTQDGRNADVFTIDGDTMTSEFKKEHFVVRKVLKHSSKP
jgi:hypothetical protein